jgi:L-methionine (R)-S-oxide reductase
MNDEARVLPQIDQALRRRRTPGAAPARRIAELIRAARRYRWVGIYEVTAEEIGILAWTGAEAPAFPRFPVTRGLAGAAVASKLPVVVGDVRHDPRYLTTFGTTESEILVPVLDGGGTVVGLVDVESERAFAFGEDDLRFVGDCARRLLPLFQR